MSNVIDMLRFAMQAERDGFHHYSSAANKTDDPKAREVFEGLANDELLHHKALEEILLETMKKGSLPQADPLRGAPSISIDDTSPIFTADFKSRIKDKHFEMSAISIGMTLEQNSIDFYRKMEETVDVPEIKTFFSRLAAWEKTHLDALSQQMSFLKEDYWTESRFEPF